MIRIFKTVQQSYILILLILYAVLINLNLYVNPPVIEHSVLSPLSNLVINGLEQIAGGEAYVLTTFFIIFMLMQATMLSFLVDQHKLLGVNTSLPALCYVLLIGLFNEYLYLSPPFLANFAVLIALGKVYSSYNTESFTQPFDMGFAIGVASLFYLPTIVLTIFVLIALNTMRVFNWRETATSLIGVLVPYVLISTYYFFNGQLDYFISTHFLSITTAITVVKVDLVEVFVKSATVLTIVGLASYFFQSQFFKSVVKIRKLLTILVHLMSISVLVFLFIEELTLAPISLLIIPLSIFLAYSFFEIQKNYLAEGIHILLLMVMLFYQYGTQLI